MLGSLDTYNVLTASQPLKDLLDKLRDHEEDEGGINVDGPDFSNTDGPQIIAYSPWVRITDLPGDDHEQADDDRFLEYPRVQVDFWISKELLPELSEVDELIRTTMHNAGWERIYHSSYRDHDTPALRMTTAYFQSQGLPV